MDWNWFFSSLSQSAAAIVGIFGAFIVTKILSNQSTFSEKKNRLRDLLRSAEKLGEDAKSRYVYWYNTRTSESQIEKLEGLLDDGADENAESLYEKLNFSVFLERAAAIAMIQARIDVRVAGRKREEQEAARRREEAEKRAAMPKSEKGIYDLGAALGMFGERTAIFAQPQQRPILRSDPNGFLVEKIGAERDAIFASIRSCRHHISLIKDFRDSIRENPESSPQITYALIAVVILFYVGVIYPLSFMPLPLNATIDPSFTALKQVFFSFRGALLGSVALIFSAVLFMFFEMNRRLKYPASEVASLKEFSYIGAYSQYYATQEENEWAAKQAEANRKASEQERNGNAKS